MSADLFAAEAASTSDCRSFAFLMLPFKCMPGAVDLQPYDDTSMSKYVTLISNACRSVILNVMGFELGRLSHQYVQ